MSNKEADVLREVYKEIRAAEKKHGPQMDVPLGCDNKFAEAADYAKSSTDRAFKNGTVTWMHIAYEEAMECFAEEDLDKIRAEALQAAAMFAKIVLVVDHQKEQANPLKENDWVLDPDYGKARITWVGNEPPLGPVAVMEFSDGRRRATALNYAQKLERLEGPVEL